MKEADSAQIGVRLHSDARQRLETLSRLSGVPLSELVRQAVAVYVSQGHQSWQESRRIRREQQQAQHVADLAPLDVKLFGQWLLSRPPDLRRLLMALGDDLRRRSAESSAPTDHLQLLHLSPMAGWSAELTEPIPTELSASAQTERILHRARLSDISQSSLEMLGADSFDEVAGQPLAGFLNLADPATFEQVARFAENDHLLLGAPLAAVDPRGLTRRIIASAVGSVDDAGYLVKLRGVMQRLVPPGESGASLAHELAIHQGLWCLNLSEPVDVRAPADDQLRAIRSAGRWSWFNEAFAATVAAGNSQRIHDISPEAILCWHESANRQGLQRFVDSGYRLAGREWVTRTFDGQMRKGRLRMTGQVVDGVLRRVYGCYEDLTELIDACRP